MTAAYTHTHVVFCGGKPLMALQTNGDVGVGRLVTRLKAHADTTYGDASPDIRADCSPEATAHTNHLPSIGIGNEEAALEQAIAALDKKMVN